MIQLRRISLQQCIVLAFCAALVIWGCSRKKEVVEETTGTIIFTANGEDFVRQGFVDKQGWSISFDNLFVNIADPVAYMPDGEKLEATLSGEYWIDLAQGDENADPITVGKMDSVPAGNYQSLRFKVKRTAEGDYNGFSIVMIGTASKENKTVHFTVKLDEEMDYDGKEGFVGDEIKGMLKAGETTTVEMTFHFDHIFGDKEAPEDDHINTGSVGFDFFNRFIKDGKVEVDQSAMKSDKDYTTLAHAMWTLGHLGEGHCEVSNQSSAAVIEE